MIVTVIVLLLFSVGIYALAHLMRNSDYPANVSLFRGLAQVIAEERARERTEEAERKEKSSWGADGEIFLEATQGRRYTPSEEVIPPLDPDDPEEGAERLTIARVWEIGRDGHIREVAPENEAPPSVLINRYNLLKK